MLRRAGALGRHGALSRPVFGKPRGTRTQAAMRKEPVPGHYYPGTPAWFIVFDEPLRLAPYLVAMWSSPDEEMRRAAIDVISEFGDSSCVTALGSVLHSDLGGDPMPDEATRCCAAHSLASINGPEAEEILWRALEHGEFSHRVREAALLGLLDLLTPDGWENYTFMNSTRVRLPMDAHARLLKLRDDFSAVVDVLAMFATDEERA